MNKELGTRVLADGRTAERLQGAFGLRDHGRRPVRGFAQPIHVFEPLAQRAAQPGAAVDTAISEQWRP